MLILMTILFIVVALIVLALLLVGMILLLMVSIEIFEWFQSHDSKLGLGIRTPIMVVSLMLVCGAITVTTLYYPISPMVAVDYGYHQDNRVFEIADIDTSTATSKQGQTIESSVLPPIRVTTATDRRYALGT